MKAGLLTLGLDLSEEDVQHVISIADYDKSGSIEYDEFVTTFGTGYQAAKVPVCACVCSYMHFCVYVCVHVYVCVCMARLGVLCGIVSPA
jgi:hypothetical protein